MSEAAVVIVASVVAVVGVVATFGVAVARYVDNRERAMSELEAAFRAEPVDSVESATAAAYRAHESAVTEKREVVGAFADRNCAACGHSDRDHSSLLQGGCYGCPSSKRCMKFVERTEAVVKQRLTEVARAPMFETEMGLRQEIKEAKLAREASVIGHRFWNEDGLYGPDKDYELSDGRVVREDGIKCYWWPKGDPVEASDAVRKQIKLYEKALEATERLKRWQEKDEGRA